VREELREDVGVRHHLGEDRASPNKSSPKFVFNI
jgi:hypothetical protein